MSYSNLAGMNPVTLPATTGLIQNTFVSINASGLLIKASTSAPIIGVTHDGTTSSTSRNACKIYPVGTIAPVKALSSTVAVGDRVSCSTAGLIMGAVAGSTTYCVGTVVKGTSGAANRVLSVMLSNIGLVS